MPAFRIRGDARAFVQPHRPIVLGHLPADKSSGYFFDLTRTFCIGPIPDALQRLHDDVLDAFTRARDAMRPRTRASEYQALVCDLFEAKGYATTRSNPKTLEGYVHSLGHGVGLEIHEKPSFACFRRTTTHRGGDIVTIEPASTFRARAGGAHRGTFGQSAERGWNRSAGALQFRP